MCEPLRSFVVAASVQRLCATVTSIRALPVAVILNWVGEGRGVVVLLRRLWKYRGSMQREGQARQV